MGHKRERERTHTKHPNGKAEQKRRFWKRECRKEDDIKHGIKLLEPELFFFNF